MAKAKKKPSSLEMQRQATEKHKKEYLMKMKYIINSYSIEDVFSFIPGYILDVVYASRHLSIKFERGLNQDVEVKVMNFLNTTAISHLKVTNIVLHPSENEISMFDYLTVYKTLNNLLTTVKANLITPFKGIDKLAISLQLLMNDSELVSEFNKNVYYILHLYSLYYSDMRKHIYSFAVENIPGFNDSGDRTLIMVNSRGCEKRSFNIDGGNRPAFRLGWVLYDEGWIGSEVKASLFKVKSENPDHKLKVYMQSHAIERLHERTDAEWIGVIQYDTFQSFQQPEVSEDSHHNFLIEHRQFTHKVGYFVANVVDGCVLVRTFLFITNNGTPEGRMLEKLTGLKKLDKKYLAIDRMSTFMNSDLVENPEIQKLLAESNCQSIIDLYHKQKDIFLANNSTSADKVLKYLKYGK